MTKLQAHTVLTAMALVAFFVPDPHYATAFNLTWIWIDTILRKGA